MGSLGGELRFVYSEGSWLFVGIPNSVKVNWVCLEVIFLLFSLNYLVLFSSSYGSLNSMNAMFF